MGEEEERKRETVKVQRRQLSGRVGISKATNNGQRVRTPVVAFGDNGAVIAAVGDAARAVDVGGVPTGIVALGRRDVFVLFRPRLWRVVGRRKANVVGLGGGGGGGRGGSVSV